MAEKECSAMPTVTFVAAASQQTLFVTYHHRLRHLWRQLHVPSEQRHLFKARFDSHAVTGALVELLQRTVATCLWKSMRLSALNMARLRL